MADGYVTVMSFPMGQYAQISVLMDSVSIENTFSVKKFHVNVSLIMMDATSVDEHNDLELSKKRLISFQNFGNMLNYQNVCQMTILKKVSPKSTAISPSRLSAGVFLK